MKIMSIKTRDNSFKDFENESHIARKQRAESERYRPKNIKQIVDNFFEDDPDEDLSKYARYIK